MELPEAQGNWDDRGLVANTLGADDKPVFLPPGDTLSTRGGKAVLDQWYRDVPGINHTTQIRLPLGSVTNRPGVYRYEDMDFFPIDQQLFGNDTPGHPEHNYHFTVEVATRFRYQGGETFHFAGDDDVWVFLNRGLVIDLGGVHQIERASVELDQVAPGLKMTPGEIYPLHIFFAERHTTQSHFLLETSITEFASCD
jgi:fibro-slime domain-containing protein